ncbi:MAG: hypothetical protein HGA19_19595, partial [Oscillochloris sp.]|nr:hypothetical protein [Oscillochloris sp.]
MLFIGPLLGWPLLIGPHPARWLQRLLTGLTVVGALAAMLSSVSVLPNVRTLANYSDYYPPLVACLDANAARYGLHNGIAHYWQSRHIEVFSRSGLHAATVNVDLSPWLWMGSSTMFDRNMNYAVVDHTDLGQLFGFLAESLTNRFGPPHATFNCGSSDVYVYNRPTDNPFQNYLHLATLQWKLNQPGHVANLNVSMLPGALGKPDGDALSADPGQKGYIVLSDWIQLEPGNYGLRFAYTADG